MAKKNNNRNIRISDQMAELIDQQVGSNFTEKWENLVTRCVWELPKKEAELRQIEEWIKRERERLDTLEKLYEKLNRIYRDLDLKTTTIVQSVNRSIHELDNL